jgi:hypothetical protein
MDPDPLVVAVIRSLMSRWIHDHHPDATDLDLAQMYGTSAQPLADGLRTAIADEVQRQLHH